MTGGELLALAEGKMLHILQHSLGVDHYGRGDQYRQHFCTGPESVDHPYCMMATEAGLMTRVVAPNGYGGMDFFYVTDAGRAYVAEHSPTPPKLTRSQDRYQRYLDADGCLSFGEWMRRDHSSRALATPINTVEEGGRES